MGQWVARGSSQVLAVHAALLPPGVILYFSGSEYNPDQHNAGLIDHARLYDCATGAISLASSPTTDLFCCGHAVLGDGRLLVAGGTERFPVPAGFHHHHWPGARDAWIFNWRDRRWLQVSEMNPAQPQDWIDDGPGGGRWYPTLATLADGSVLAMSGHPGRSDGRHTNNTPEIYINEQNRWLLRKPFGVESFPGAEAVVPVQYPRLHLLPWGDVCCVTPMDGTNRSVRYDPRTERKSYVGQPFTNTDYLDPAIAGGLNTTSVLLPFTTRHPYRAQVLLCGSNDALRIDLDDVAARWVPTASRALEGSPRRFNLTAVLLPTGDVFVSGGVSDPALRDSSGVRVAEIYHPDSDRWEAVEEAHVVRNYHSVALVMPDGAVWTAGSNHDHEPSTGVGGLGGRDTRELRIEVYEPDYVHGARPVVTVAPRELAYGETFELQVRSASRIGRVAMLRTGSSTHAFDSDQRYVEVLFSPLDEGRVLATAPAVKGVAPAGNYLLFVLSDANTPSIGHFVQLSAELTRPATGTGFAVCPEPGVVEVFWVRPDGMVFTNARDPHINSGNWNNPVPIAAAVGAADPRSGVAAVCPAPGIVEVFWVRPDGMVFTNARDPHINSGNWNNPVPIAAAAGAADPRSGVAAVCPAPGIVEVFWVRPDGMVFTNARDPRINSGNWNNPVPIAAAAGAADPRSGVAAVCPAPGIVEVFWVRPDGMVFTNARDPHINSGNWNNPVPIAAAAGAADPRSGVAAVCPAPGIVEVFWVRPDGMVFTNARDPRIDHGNWNKNPVPIAEAAGAAAVRDV
jgi:hypothetical protein